MCKSVTHTFTDVSPLALPVILLPNQFQHLVPSMVSCLVSSVHVNVLDDPQTVLVVPDHQNLGENHNELFQLVPDLNRLWVWHKTVM